MARHIYEWWRPAFTGSEHDLGIRVRDDGGPLGVGAVGLLEDVEVSEEDVRPRVRRERAHRPNLKAPPASGGERETEWVREPECA